MVTDFVSNEALSPARLVYSVFKSLSTFFPIAKGFIPFLIELDSFTQPPQSSPSNEFQRPVLRLFKED